MLQRTIAQPVSCHGVGLHSGAAVTMTLKPAIEADQGIVFVRTDLPFGRNIIPARTDFVNDTMLCTQVDNGKGATVDTIEHVMSALNAAGVDNAIIELDGPEIPAMDGSAQPFLEIIERAGLQKQAEPRYEIEITQDISVAHDGKIAALSPAPYAMFDFSIDFPDTPIGQQAMSIALLNGNYAHDIAPACTFGFETEVAFLREKMGKALGASEENAIGISASNEIMNPERLHGANHFVAHKILDAIGDLYLAGMRIRGHYKGEKAGHDMNHRLLQELFANPESYVILDTETGERIAPDLFYSARRVLDDKRAVAHA